MDSVQSRSALSSAFAMTMSLRMTAVMDLCGFSDADEMCVFCLDVWVEAGCDEGGHVERLADVGSACVDVRLAGPLA
jgi:hypothetical protein